MAQASSTLAALQQRQQEVADQLAAAGRRGPAHETELGDLQRSSSQLVAAARQQALSSYMRGDAAGQSFALASALGQSNVNDAIWSLGVLRSPTTRRSSWSATPPMPRATPTRS